MPGICRRSWRSLLRPRPSGWRWLEAIRPGPVPCASSRTQGGFLRRSAENDAEKVRAFIAVANAGLAKAIPFQDRVYRGVAAGRELFEQMADRYAAGEIVEEAAFTSSSLVMARGFGGNVRMVIDSRTGVDISDISQCPANREVLFRAGSLFRVKAVQRKGGRLNIWLEDVTDG